MKTWYEKSLTEILLQLYHSVLNLNTLRQLLCFEIKGKVEELDLCTYMFSLSEKTYASRQLKY